MNKMHVKGLLESARNNIVEGLYNLAICDIVKAEKEIFGNQING